MQRVRVAGFGVSLDGFSAGTQQGLNDPLGKRGPEIFRWFFHTKTFCAMHGKDGGSIDLDDEFARRSMENFGAFILGRNMFGPVRGPWPGGSWKGWWGQPAVPCGNVRADALREGAARDGGRNDVPLCHPRNRRGVEARETGSRRQGRQNRRWCSTARQYLRARLIDSLHFALAPVVLGQGEALFTGLDLPTLGFSVTEHKATEQATHFVLEKG